jgi:hypothetical protein
MNYGKSKMLARRQLISSFVVSALALIYAPIVRSQSGLPFTYEHDDKQYLTIFVSDGSMPFELVAYTLP